MLVAGMNHTTSYKHSSSQQSGEAKKGPAKLFQAQERQTKTPPTRRNP